MVGTLLDVCCVCLYNMFNKPLLFLSLSLPFSLSLTKSRTGRLLERGKESGRSDDNIETIRKRFKTHQESTVPIIDYFKTRGISVHSIDTAKSVGQVYDTIIPFFQ
jgi:adenylate kinase family enzyme